MPYWRLSSFYFFYFATVGILIPYWGLYLQSLGFSPYQIGQQAGLLLITKIVAPNVWGWIADHTGRVMQVVRLAAILALVLFSGVYMARDYWWLTLVMVGFGFFWHAALPQVEATTLNYLGEDRHRYGRIRLWGSIGFIVLSVGLGPWVDAYGPAAILPVLSSALLAIALVTWWIPDRRSGPHYETHASLRQLFRHREVVALLLICFLMQVSHAPFYTFFSIYLTGYGYSKTVIGALWAVGVICEIGIFLISHWMFRCISLNAMLLTAFAATALRWFLVALYPEHLWLIVMTQVMHALTYGVYHAAAIQFIHRLFRGRHQHRGQALYSSVSFGLGGGIGSYLSGLLWSQYNAQVTFLAAAVVAGIACLVIVFWIRPAAHRPAG